MLLKIPRLYDSHTHFLGTGQIKSGLTLFHLTKAEDIGQIRITPAFLRGDWLVGFGWDENKWQTPGLPNKEILDHYFPDQPVFFSRADGHSSWVNSKALQILGMYNKSETEFPNPPGGVIQRDLQGRPTGVLSDAAHMMVFEKLPPYTATQMREFLLASARIFNEAGFTHIRDMSCTEQQWNEMAALENEKKLTIAMDANYTVEGLHDLPRALRECLYARQHETSLLRAKGLKLFYDGSLGSETAYLSQPYHGRDGGERGLATWDLQDVEEVLRSSWRNNLEFSVHTIGDQAVHEIVELARKVSASGEVGKLNLEHVQVIRPETLVMMKPLHIKCHMQPCHWLSDRSWLQEKLGVLYKYAFPWEALRAAQIPLSFGSDSPIESPSLPNNLRALKESAEEGIRPFRGDPVAYHSHSDKNFADSFTVFEDDQVKEVWFNGQRF